MMTQTTQSAMGKKNNNKTEKNNNCMLCCNTLMQFDLEWKRSGKNHTAQLIYPDRNGTVRYLAISTHTLGPVHLKLVEVKVFASTMWNIHTATGETLSIVLLADQHRKWSCLAGAPSCFWTQGTEYNIQQVTQSTQFQPATGNFLFLFFNQ